MTKTETFQEFTSLVLRVGQAKDEKEENAALDSLKKLLVKNGNRRLLDDYIAKNIRSLYSKDKITPEEKKVATSLLCLSLDLASEELTDAFEDHEKLKKFVKDKCIEVVKYLVSIGLSFLK